jgi:hypothetical protein
MSEKETIGRIQAASSVFSLAKTLYQQLLYLEDSKFDECRRMYDFLVLIQTSLYSTIVLNLSHLLKDGEKHSIGKLLNISVEYCGLEKESAEKLISELQASEQEIDALVRNRDKRIAHFDKKELNSLNDRTITYLMELTERLLKTINSEVLKRDHSFGIPMNTSMEKCMQVLYDEFVRITKREQ